MDHNYDELLQLARSGDTAGLGLSLLQGYDWETGSRQLGIVHDRDWLLFALSSEKARQAFVIYFDNAYQADPAYFHRQASKMEFLQARQRSADIAQTIYLAASLTIRQADYGTGLMSFRDRLPAGLLAGLWTKYHEAASRVHRQMLLDLLRVTSIMLNTL